jgi:integrase
MTALEWRDVDLPGRLIRLRPELSKNKNGRPLPLEGELLEIIQRAFRGRRLDCEYVFQRNGRRIGDFKRAWRTACLVSGHPSLLVPDFRRTTVRNLTRARVPEKIAMTMIGHKTRSVFDRYNIVDERDLAQAAGQLNSYLDERSQEPSVTPIRKMV